MARPKIYDESQVLYAATMCFWQHGYSSTSMKNLETATQLSSGSLYNSFGSKEQLFQLTLEFYTEKVVGKRIRKYLHDGNAYNGIKEFIFHCFNSTPLPNNIACLLVNTATELAPHEVKIKTFLNKTFRHIDDALTVAVKRGQQQGDIHADKDPEQLARHLSFLLNGMLVNSKVTNMQNAGWKNSIDKIVSSVLD